MRYRVETDLKSPKTKQKPSKEKQDTKTNQKSVTMCESINKLQHKTYVLNQRANPTKKRCKLPMSATKTKETVK